MFNLICYWVNCLKNTISEDVFDMIAEQLLTRIEEYRERMIHLAGYSSIKDSRVVEVSAELDTLIIQYIHLTKKQ